MVEEGTRIARFDFKIPVPRDFVSPQMTLRDVEVTRANFDGQQTPLKDGVYTLDENHRVQTRLVVKDGKGDISLVNPNSVPHVEEMYGPLPHILLEQPGQTYVHDMKDGKVVSMVVCLGPKYTS